MRLVYSEYDFDITFQENFVNIVVIENPTILTEFISELNNQVHGMEGKFVLSEKNKILPFHKYVNLLIDIFSLNCNEKKILSKLYQELEELAKENFVLENFKVNTAIRYYLEEICEQVPYHLKYELEASPSMIIKMMDLKIETEAVTLLEQIIEYLSITSKINRNMLYIFLNIKMFLTEEEINSLYEYMFYNKIQILFLEGSMRKRQENEKITIIDMDKCTIKI